MSANALDIFDDLIQGVSFEESKLMKELKALHEQISQDYHEEIKKYIQWKMLQKKNLADYHRKYLLKRLKEQREKVTHDIHEHLSRIRLMQRYTQER